MANDITIDNVYPWGRSFDEYRRMFALTDADLDVKILSCADGPASFNAEIHRRGRRVVSCDPLYQFGVEAIRSRVGLTAVEMIRNVRENAHRFVWDRIKSPEHMAMLRQAAMEIFLGDYEAGRADRRYVNAKLPRLPFADKEFDLAICSHFLFLYQHDLSLGFHVKAAMEMCRVAQEVRIFPLLNMAGEKSAYVQSTIEQLSQAGWRGQIETVDYEFQRGGNQMLRIRGA